jgi:hypothetical protein
MAKYGFFLVVCLFYFFYSCTFDECSNKSIYITSFDKFVKEVEHDYRDFSKADWEKAQFRFDKLTGECYEKFEKEFTSAEERKIFKNSLKYSFFKLSSELQVDLKSDEMKQFSEEINKLIDSEKDLNKIIKKIENNKDFKKASEDLKMGVEHFGKGLEKIGKELEKVLKDIENKS